MLQGKELLGEKHCPNPAPSEPDPQRRFGLFSPQKELGAWQPSTVLLRVVQKLWSIVCISPLPPSSSSHRSRWHCNKVARDEVGLVLPSHPRLQESGISWMLQAIRNPKG